MSLGGLLLSAGFLVPSRQEAAGATETCKGVSGGRLSSLPEIAEIYGCSRWISIRPKCPNEITHKKSVYSLQYIEISNIFVLNDH